MVGQMWGITRRVQVCGEVVHPNRFRQNHKQSLREKTLPGRLPVWQHLSGYGLRRRPPTASEELDYLFLGFL